MSVQGSQPAQAIGYVRVSTDRQADVGVSLQAQTEKIRAMATVQGVELVDVLIDAGESAKSLKRPAMAALLDLVDREAIQTVIIAKLDRLTRSVADLAELLKRFERRGVSLVSVADSLDTRTAAGRLVINIMTSVSQWEREAIGERTRDALGHKRAAGQRVGTVPYGYRLGPDGRRLVPDSDEQRVIRLVQAWAAEGMSLRAIAARLNGARVTTRRNTPWRYQYIAPLLAHEPRTAVA